MRVPAHMSIGEVGQSSGSARKTPTIRFFNADGTPSNWASKVKFLTNYSKDTSKTYEIAQRNVEGGVVPPIDVNAWGFPGERFFVEAVFHTYEIPVYDPNVDAPPFDIRYGGPSWQGPKLPTPPDINIKINAKLFHIGAVNFVSFIASSYPLTSGMDFRSIPIYGTSGTTDKDGNTTLTIEGKNLTGETKFLYVYPYGNECHSVDTCGIYKGTWEPLQYKIDLANPPKEISFVHYTSEDEGPEGGSGDRGDPGLPGSSVTASTTSTSSNGGTKTGAGDKTGLQKAVPYILGAGALGLVGWIIYKKTR